MIKEIWKIKNWHFGNRQFALEILKIWMVILLEEKLVYLSRKGKEEFVNFSSIV